MDLTLPETPGEIIGYRRNGTPIRLIAGASPDDPSNTPADTDPAAEPETGAEEETVDWKAKYEEMESKYRGQKKVNRDLERRYKREPRPSGQPATGDEDDDAAEDERVEAARQAAIERELQAAARAAAYKVGGRAPELLDSVSFLKKLDKLDVEDADEFEEEAEKLMRAEVKKLPPKGPPKKQGADVSGGGNDRERPKSVREAFARKYGN